MTSSSRVEQEVELQGSSWDGAFLVTLTICASNQAPMFVSRASTYSLTCEEKENALIQPREGTLLSTDKDLFWFLVPAASGLDRKPKRTQWAFSCSAVSQALWPFGAWSLSNVRAILDTVGC